MSKTSDAVVPSTTNQNRPRLRTSTEMKLAEIDERSAAAYADAEDLVAQLAVCAAEISTNESAIPDEIDPLSDTSAVRHIEHLRERLITDEQVALAKEYAERPRAEPLPKPAPAPTTPKRRRDYSDR